MKMVMRYGPWLPSKQMAKALGAKTYFTGQMCGRGHCAPRKTCSAVCMDCKAEDSLTSEAMAKAAVRQKVWNGNPEKATLRRARQMRFHASHREERARKKREMRELASLFAATFSDGDHA